MLSRISFFCFLFFLSKPQLLGHFFLHVLIHQCTAGDKIADIHSFIITKVFESSFYELSRRTYLIWSLVTSELSAHRKWLRAPLSWQIQLPSENVSAVCHTLNIINTLILPFQSVVNTEKPKHSLHLTVTEFHCSPQHRKASFKPFSRLSDKPAARPGVH